MIDPKVPLQLGNEIDELREKVAQLESERDGAYAAVDANWISHQQLAAAQATIARQREALEEVSGLIEESHGVVGLHLNGDEAPWEELLPGGRFERLTTLYEALAIPANLDALHEARAQVLEKADRIFMQMSVELKDTLLRYAYNAARDVLKKEAAAHRARKEGK